MHGRIESAVDLIGTGPHSTVVRCSAEQAEEIHRRGISAQIDRCSGASIAGREFVHLHDRLIIAARTCAVHRVCVVAGLVHRGIVHAVDRARSAPGATGLRVRTKLIEKVHRRIRDTHIHHRIAACAGGRCFGHDHEGGRIRARQLASDRVAVVAGSMHRRIIDAIENTGRARPFPAGHRRAVQNGEEILRIGVRTDREVAVHARIGRQVFVHRYGGRSITALGIAEHRVRVITGRVDQRIVSTVDRTGAGPYAAGLGTCSEQGEKCGGRTGAAEIHHSIGACVNIIHGNGHCGTGAGAGASDERVDVIASPMDRGIERPVHSTTGT